VRLPVWLGISQHATSSSLSTPSVSGVALTSEGARQCRRDRQSLSFSADSWPALRAMAIIGCLSAWRELLAASASPGMDVMTHQTNKMPALYLLLLLGGTACGGGSTGDDLPWGNAGRWEMSNAAGPRWDWILDTDELPNPPPALDYFGIDGLDVEAAYVATVVARGAKPWCYLSIGTAENWREDYRSFMDLDALDRSTGNEGVVGRVYPEWRDERWLNVRRYELFFPLIEARLDICRDKGFALVELDNMDAFETDTGFEIDPVQEERYVRAIARAAAARGMGVIQKNATSLSSALVADFALLLLEDCVLSGTCSDAQPYVEAGKPVFTAEYPQNWEAAGRSFDLRAVCSAALRAGTSPLIKTLDLTAQTIVCSALADPE
jgi:endo-alpha-1,4-polygalactosaminidase (GH114 family)